MNEQEAVPLVVAFEALQENINGMFLPFEGDLTDVEDPLVSDYVELLKTIAAIHAADILTSSLKNGKNLLKQPDLLRAELLKRLGQVENFKDMITHSESRNGFTIQGVAARAYLEAEVARSVARAA